MKTLIFSRRIRTGWAAGVAAAALGLGTAAAQEPASVPAEKPEVVPQAPDPVVLSEEPSDVPDGKIHAVEEGPFAVEIEFDGVIAPREATEIAVAPDEWESLTVVEAADHGERVRKGETLVVFDTEDLEEKIADMEAAKELTETTIESTRRALGQARESAPLNKELAQRTAQQAGEDLDYFTRTGRELAEKSAEFSLKRTEQYLAYAEEELEQLEKMYEADDITEETEEIILQRARNDVESARFSLESTRERTKRELEVEIPRQQTSLETGSRQAELALIAAEQNQPLALAQQELELTKMERDAARAADELEGLRRDLERLQVTAPHDGIVFYGEEENGKWATAAAVKKKLRPGGTVTPHEVFMTIAGDDPLMVRAVIPEDKLSEVLRVGVSGTASPAAAPGANLPVQLAEIDFIPLPEGGYSAALEFADDAEVPDRTAPGMGCKVKLTPYEKDAALTVPAAAIRDRRGSSGRILIEGEDEPREVKLGPQSGDRIEVVEGLEAGARVVVPEGAAKEEKKDAQGKS